MEKKIVITKMDWFAMILCVAFIFSVVGCYAIFVHEPLPRLMP